jgi:hypothetical protein
MARETRDRSSEIRVKVTGHPDISVSDYGGNGVGIYQARAHIALDAGSALALLDAIVATVDKSRPEVITK